MAAASVPRRPPPRPPCRGFTGLGLRGGNDWVIGLAVAAFSIGYKAQPPVIESLLVDMMEDEYRGGDLGAAKTIATGIGALGPAYIGFVVERAGYDIAFLGLVGFLSASALIVAYMTFTNKLKR